MGLEPGLPGQHFFMKFQKIVFTKFSYLVSSVNLQQSIYISFYSELLRGRYDIGDILEQ